MWIRCPFIALTLFAASLTAREAEAASGSPPNGAFPSSTSTTITNAATFAGLSAQEANRAHPLRLEGVITRLDIDHNLLVLQDAAGAVALEMPLTNVSLRSGDHVVITGASGIPCATAFPEFPAHPHEREVRDSFETETDARVYSLTRLRGFLRPPKTGLYKFWIASKGASELWLSTNADPGLAIRVAIVPAGKSTNPRQWNKYPAQMSGEVFLRADTPCYIEAIREQRGGRGENLAVAWSGPELAQSVIGGQFLTPWMDPQKSPSATAEAGRAQGILQEVWTNFFVGLVEPLTVRSVLPSPVTVVAPRIDVQGRGAFPEPLRIRPGDAIEPEDHHRWVEIEGTVTFMSRDGDELTLEVGEGAKRTLVRVANWTRQDWPRLEQARVRVRGVCEAALNAEGRSVAGTVWVPSMAELTEMNATIEDWNGLKRTPISQLSPTNPDLAWGRRIRVRGTVTHQHDGSCFLQAPGSFWAYLSRDGTNWAQIAPPVEVEMGEEAQTGLVVTSLDQDSLATAVFDHVQGLDGVGKQTGVHDSTPPGTASLADSVYTLEGGGRGIASAFDEFHFSHQSIGGGTEIVARLVSIESANPRGSAGIMVRDSLNSAARCVALTMTPGRGALFQVRRKEGARGDILELPGYTAPCWLKLTRRQFELVAHLRDRAQAQTGQIVDVTGLLAWEQGKPVLREADCLEPATPETAQRAALTDRSRGTDGVGVVPISSFLPQEGMALKDGTGVTHVRGVVTFFGLFDNAYQLSVQDETGGAFVRLSGRFASRPVRVGELVEMELKSRNGKWPVPFDPGRINVLGWGQLPEPVAHPAEYSLPLRGAGSWVELEGMVWSAAPDGTLTVMGKDGPLPVWVAGLPKGSGRDYVDSLVRVRGTLFRTDDDAPVLLTPSPAFVQVTEPPPEAPFVIPTLPIAELKQLNFSDALTHRLKVAGVVTYKEDGQLLVQDESAGVRVRGVMPSSVKVGDTVEVAGFPDSGGGAFKLTEALLNRTGSGGGHEPARRSVEDLLEGDFDAALVRVKALLLGRRTHGQKQILELQSGQRMFQATLAEADGELPVFPSGSTIELTGVCLAERLGSAAVSESGKPLVSSFQLLLRSPRDVALLQRPPWWTWKHTASVVGALVLVLLGAMMWIRQLHWQVAERTQALRATMARLEEETKTSATLAERNRLAAEIHDGLEQGLNGIMMQLDGVETKLKRSPEAAQHHLDLARKMVRFSRTEVRHSLWDWKAPALANHDLKAALTDIVAQMAEGRLTRVAVKVSGESRPLPPTMEHHLLRIAQEALTNALKHAHARNITVNLNYTDGAVELSVHDDGRGFVPDTVLNGLVGHLGLQNLRSRARNLGGELIVTSEPEKGATITVRIPCPPGNSGTT